ncbi:cobyrinate a,c-diamide synthase [Flexivirga meconopsidis]|uniref:cobyrinate a,c-diamide synthase n=1 Tax=Flexivirga meconopsidis TaxID=2977121 RepID=UPI00223F3089
MAAPASGQGKTTIAVGLMAALRAAGQVVGAAKVGPDYIDPGYHALATGRRSRNLDPVLTSPDLVGPLLRRAAEVPHPADITVIEGVMGLFDGRLGTDGFGSSGWVAAHTQTPVLVVVDISHVGNTVGALVAGLAGTDPEVQVVGVILNKAGSARHADEARRAVERIGLPVLGVIPRDTGLHVPSRHLGLVPVDEHERAAAALDSVARTIADHVDLDRVLRLSRCAPQIDCASWDPVAALQPAQPVSDAPVVAVSGGRVFTFRYPETVELLEAAGCRVEFFDPIMDRELPAGTSALYLGGGFPEVHAAALSHNRPLRSQIKQVVAAGMPTVAECAGMLYLADELDGQPMTGAIPVVGAMHRKLVLGYREARLATDSVLGPAGTTVTGHEFHRTRVTPAAGAAPAWLLSYDGGCAVPDGFALDPAGTGRASVVASYLHLEWAGHPQLAANFAVAAADFAGTDIATPSPAAHRPTTPEHPAPDPLDHHGDDELAEGLVDLAVNVRVSEPPAWLADRLRRSMSRLAAYPDLTAARRAVAQAHGIAEHRVLLTAGADEAFTLIARCGLTQRAAVVHPQFTEPEAALRRAEIQVERILLDAAEDFTLTDETISNATASGADLIVIGNPTNPTGVLHPRAAIEQLAAPGRLVVVDEAFLDAIPGEPESFLQAGQRDDVIVVRSLTKTWGLAGLRVGYVIAAPTVIDRLRSAQQHWPVGTLAAEAVLACSTATACAEAARAAEQQLHQRDHLAERLHEIGVRTVPGMAPFVLAQPGVGIRERLRDNGFAVRRCDTFPGLDAGWIRIAARDFITTDALITSLRSVLQPAQEPAHV